MTRNNQFDCKFNFTYYLLKHTLPYFSPGRLPAEPGDTFEFAQLHWHWGFEDSQGSEHTVDGMKSPMEVHLVHWNKKYGTVAEALKHSDGLAVIGFMYEVSCLVSFCNSCSTDCVITPGVNRK